MAKSIPAGWRSVTPRLVAHDPCKPVEFLQRAFGASGDFVTDRPSQIRIGNSIVMVSGSVRVIRPLPLMYLYVDDIDAAYPLALRAGAVSLEAPMDTPYGDRRAMIQDPCGNDWQIATHKGTGG